MADLTIDLSGEHASDLESVGRSFLSEWLWERIKEIGIALFLLALCGFLIWWIPHTRSSGMPASSFVERLILAPKDFLEFAAFGGAILFALGGIASLVGTMVRLLSGPPKAPRKPEKTIRVYYRDCLRETMAGQPMDASVEAYVCLLNQAKQKFKSYLGFQIYWEETIESIKKEVAEAVVPNQVDNRNYLVSSVKTDAVSERIMTYSVGISATASSGLGTTIDPKKTVGKLEYEASGIVVKVGERWYIADGQWNGKFSN